MRATSKIKMRKVALIAASVLMTTGFTSLAQAGGKASIDPGAPAEGARQVAKKAPPPAKKADAQIWNWKKDATASTSRKQTKERQAVDSQGTQAQGIER
ncbi:MAG TPA: hypothetical protein VJT77_06480 [Burkholderiales bacterium]|nr:hypothetical protein [Burkholderiales bacterium]